MLGTSAQLFDQMVRLVQEYNTDFALCPMFRPNISTSLMACSYNWWLVGNCPIKWWDKHVLGTMGERIIAKWLGHCGFVLLDHNLRLAHGEIDLGVKRNELYSAVEVRTRLDSRSSFSDDCSKLFPPLKLSRCLTAGKLWASRYNSELHSLLAVACIVEPENAFRAAIAITAFDWLNGEHAVLN